MKKLKTLSHYCVICLMISFLNTNCAGPKSIDSSSVTPNIDPANNTSSNTTLPQSQIISNVVENNQKISSSEKNKSLGNNHKDSKGHLKELVPAENRNQKASYSNYIRVKTVYELAMEANPSMFFPHDEFETVNEYKERVSGQVGLMKEIVQMTTQKSEIKKAKRLQVAKEKELKRKAVVETLMSESSSPVEFQPNDIGRYDAENETFPIAT